MEDIQDVFALVKMETLDYPCNLDAKEILKWAKIFQGKISLKAMDKRGQ
jgi:hypothetical protein